ncbi:hypothetical protein C8R45DRAFT_1221378 [Mycena sanguinolenta]|nr:hypothetical protein C8R45DRAFT_1221378 [Mycena sanguinolenta]
MTQPPFEMIKAARVALPISTDSSGPHRPRATYQSVPHKRVVVKVLVQVLNRLYAQPLHLDCIMLFSTAALLAFASTAMALDPFQVVRVISGAGKILAFLKPLVNLTLTALGLAPVGNSSEYSNKGREIKQLSILDHVRKEFDWRNHHDVSTCPCEAGRCAENIVQSPRNTERKDNNTIWKFAIEDREGYQISEFGLIPLFNKICVPRHNLTQVDLCLTCNTTTGALLVAPLRALPEQEVKY